MTEAILRPSARVLLADQHDRLLLFQLADGTWITPGGGLGEGEPAEVAAARELREETGHVVAPDRLGPVVAITAGHWIGGWDGLLYYSVERFFFLRVAAFTPDTSGFTHYERRDIIAHHWWPLPELRVTLDRVIPWGLPGLLAGLYAGQVPDAPVALPWHHPELAYLPPPG